MKEERNVDLNELLKDLDLTTDEGRAEAQRRITEEAEKEAAALAQKKAGDVAKLEAKNKQLLAEKKAQDEKLKAALETINTVGGEEGLKELQELQVRLEHDDLLKVLKEDPAKFAEQMTANVEARLEKRYQRQIEKANQERDTTAQERDDFKGKFFGKMVSDSFTQAALDAECQKGAVPYIHYRAQQEGWTYDPEQDAVVQLDKDGQVVFGDDAKTPLSPKDWLEGKRDSETIWWPESAPGGSQGGNNRQGPAGKFTISQSDARDHAKYAAVRAEAEKAGESVQITDD